MDKEYLINRLQDMASQYKLDISPEILGGIVNISLFRVVKKGEILGKIGDDTGRAGLVLKGMIRCYYIDGNGNDVTRGFSIPGTFCMDEGMFGYRERLTEWEALEETALMLFDVREIKKMIAGCGQLQNMYIMFLENALRYKIYRENTFLVENAAERYIYFRRLYPEICANVKQQYIATYLGIAPESLSRIRKQLKETELL